MPCFRQAPSATLIALMPELSPITLHTDRLTLRPLRDSDAEALFEVWSDPIVTRYLARPAWTTLDQAHERIGESAELREAWKYLRFGVALTETDRVIGECGLFHFNDQSRRAEIGYVLACRAWGRGYMNEALEKLVLYGFRELALNRIEAEIDPRNLASSNTLERIGFTKEGHLRERWIVEGEVSDSGFYGLLFNDWSERSSARTA